MRPGDVEVVALSTRYTVLGISTKVWTDGVFVCRSSRVMWAVERACRLEFDEAAPRYGARMPGGTSGVFAAASVCDLRAPARMIALPA